MGCGVSRPDSTVFPVQSSTANQPEVPSNTPEPDRSTLHEPFTSTDHQPPPETTANHPMPPLTRHFSPPPQITTHHTFPPPLSLHYSLPHTSSSQQTNTVTSNAPRSPHRSQSDLFTRRLAGPGSSRSSRENVPSPLVGSWQSRRCNSAGMFEIVRSGPENLSDSFPPRHFDRLSPSPPSTPPHPSSPSHLPLPSPTSPLQQYSTQSQVEFFTMLDKKIEAGPDCCDSSSSKATSPA